MNPELERFIKPIIELHKQGTGNILDWSNLRMSLPDLQKSDREGLKLAMIKMGIIEASNPGNTAYTRLIDFYFDLEKYKKDKEQEEDKKDIDYKLVKQQLKDYPIVQDRADDAIKISKAALLVSIAGLLLLVIQWLCSGKD